MFGYPYLSRRNRFLFIQYSNIQKCSELLWSSLRKLEFRIRYENGCEFLLLNCNLCGLRHCNGIKLAFIIIPHPLTATVQSATTRIRVRSRVEQRTYV